MKSRRYGAAFAILAALLLILLAMNLCIGSVNIPLSEILHILMKNSGSDTYTDIVMLCWAVVWHWQAICFRHFFIIPLRDLLRWAFLPVQNWWLPL